MSDWWATIGDPFVKAFLSLDIHEIQAAFLNLPHTYYTYIHEIYIRSPEHVIIETFLICFVIYIALFKKDRPNLDQTRLTDAEIQELCDEWTPDPIVPLDFKECQPLGIVEKCPNTHIKLKGRDKEMLNLATFDFLGIGSRDELKQVAIKTLTKYGCGSCGPRGFYGTIDVHEILEKDLATMMGTLDAIILSDSEATSSSVLPAFAKRGDLVVVDEGCNDSILIGANLARSTVFYYKHNDLAHLESILASIRQADDEAGRKSDCQRRYVVTEALFRNHGDLIDLPKMLALCDKYFFRLFLDESFSFGVLGKLGRGITEYHNVQVSDIAIICASLGGAAASVGGFSTGSYEVVDYQRLNSAGYVFSASSPPFTAACCSEALRIMQKEPNLREQLRENSNLLYTTLQAQCESFTLKSYPYSPILHLRVKESLLEGTELEKRRVAREICDRVMNGCLERGIAVTSPRYKTNQLHEPWPSIRLTVTAIHTKEQLEEACPIIVDECKKAMEEIAGK